jgi:uncharacterized protein DUF5681
MPVNFQQKQGGRARRDARGRFPQGASGNPAGRPPGSRNAATALAEALLDGEAGALVRKCIEMALDGNIAAIKLCLERLVPRRGRSATLDMPEIATVADILAAMRGVARAVATGGITATDGAELSRLLETLLRAMEAGEFERRLKELEDDRAARA